MALKIRLPGGTLKVKQHHELRRREQKREVPVWQVGKYFVVWWPATISDRPSKRPGGERNDFP
ncbi:MULTISPECIES: hypothetical protein [unclassified Mesorhizobium]|uniref:hypothetical protein n=1 Tax=unclassified Mesorhizobium TaxID=325217 RepID=UPI0011267C2F|nr:MULTISPECIES: hypothetical protein [unclassified Mesorhizobium]MBZ9739212.1 hypothetical protein [Mesorhizobium sp. CO1-1-4]MBZ9802483.1 hypothetical protein [Mesorhizobium sp. ES1-6]TPL91878.1 hypothetical protein FJ948_15815 [Mesorhizobium sp. B2-3-12]